MNGMALLGILMAIYGLAVCTMTFKKPEKIWSMKKIQLFLKVLGSKGTDWFFYIFGALCFAAGVWLVLSNQ